MHVNIMDRHVNYMNFFDKKFDRKEKKYRRTYEIENTLFTELESLTEIYDASVPDLINACIEYLVATENMALYEKDKTEITPPYTLLIKESNLAGLENLKAKYGVSIYRLVNIAIRNMLSEVDQ